jgi:trk system potassium uptake protein TrkA
VFSVKVIIVGGGEVGFYFAEWLASEHKEVIVIDKDEQALRRMIDHLDVQTILGSGSNPRMLEEAGIKGADIILAVTDSDEVNLVACFFANMLAPEIHKVALIRNDDYSNYRDQMARDIVDISLIINPEAEVVHSIRRIMSAPDVEQIHDFAGGRIKMVGKRLPAESPLSGIRLTELPAILKKQRLIIAAVVRGDRLIIPKGKDVLQTGDFVYFVCQQEDLNRTLTLFGGESSSVKNLMIVGGGKIGRRLALELDRNKGFQIKLIEMDPERCQKLAAELHRTIVLQGLATDQAFMEQENMGSMDLVAAVTWDEEMNILSSLLAKRLGAKKTVARVNKFAYIPLVHAIGIDHIVSPRRCAIDSIMPTLRRGKVMNTVFIKGKEAEVLEAVALEQSSIVGAPLKDVKFPKEALVLCLARGEEVLLPSGDTVIQPQDRVIILSTRNNIPRVEQSLMSKRRMF